MEAGVLGVDSFGRQQFGRCDLGDKRLTDRLVHTADVMAGHPGGTLPDKLDRTADLVGFYRLANHPNVTHARLIAAHAARTRELIGSSAGSTILVIHDTTEIDYSGLDVDGLGQIGNGGGRGFLCHNSLAYDFDAGEALGLVGQLVRPRRKVPKKETPKQKRDHPDRESRLWKQGWQACGNLPADKVMHVADRGSDLLEFIEAVHRDGGRYVIRSKSNRNVDLDDGRGGVVRAKLHEFARGLPGLGERSVAVPAGDGRPARTARVRVAAGPVSIKPPHFARGEHSADDLPAWVVHVREIDPPDGHKPLEWILLSNVPAQDFASACKAIDWYGARPVIEELHKAKKTGCGIELTQFTTAHALQVCIAILSVVATQLLRLRDLARNPDAADTPAADVFDPDYVTAASSWRFGQPRPDLTVHDFCMAVAKLGGHLNRKHDGPPGWLTLWRGWTKLQQVVQALRQFRQNRCV